MNESNWQQHPLHSLNYNFCSLSFPAIRLHFALKLYAGEPWLMLAWSQRLLYEPHVKCLYEPHVPRVPNHEDNPVLVATDTYSVESRALGSLLLSQGYRVIWLCCTLTISWYIHSLVYIATFAEIDIICWNSNGYNWNIALSALNMAAVNSKYHNWNATRCAWNLREFH